MQEPINLPPVLVTPDPLPGPPKETPAFPSDFDGILFWDGAVPAVTTPYNIDDIKATRNAYEKLVAIALSAHVQIQSSFQGSRTSVRNGLEKHMASAIDTYQSSTLEAALKKKAIIVELLQRASLNKSWSEADTFFGIDALSMDSTESSELFAAYVDAEEYDGASRSLYEGFLRSLTAAYVKRTLLEAISMLEEAWRPQGASATAS